MMSPAQSRSQSRRRARYQLQMPTMPLALTAPRGIATRHLEGFDQSIQHPEFGLEPDVVISIYRQAEQGWSCTQADLFQGVLENDGHLRATVEGRINAVAGKSWQVLPGGDDGQSIAAAAMLDATLKITNFGEQLSHMLGARPIGWSGVEIIWDRVGPDILPVWFLDVPTRRFSFNSRDAPELINELSSRTDPLEPGKWIFTRSKGIFGGRTARNGLLRTATWYALFKKWSWRDWVIYAEKFGIPLVVGRYKAGALEDEKAILEEAVEDIGEAGQATMSEETNIEITEAQRGGDSNGLHRSIVKEANEELSKLITGSTLTMSTGGNGSFAQASVHANTSFANVQADEKMLRDSVAMNLFRPFLEWNGFTQAKVPRLVVHISQETDGIARAKEVDMLQAMGMEIDSEQMREEFHLRVPPTPDRVLGRVDQSQQPGGSNVEDTE